MSVIAGVSTVQITEMIGKEIPVIRVMPNTSASIGYSATAITQGEFASQKDLVIAKELFEAIGTVNIVEEEKMHVVTGMSCSGPAYIYYLVEAMQEAEIERGLEQVTATELITRTVIGAGMMVNTSELPADVLREHVTSPNSTREAALNQLSE